MTYEEALDRAFASDWEHHFKFGDDNVKREEAKQMIIEACKRIEAKKPNISLHGTTDLNTKATCPTCHSMVFTEKYCRHCGQALDWSDEQ